MLGACPLPICPHLCRGVDRSEGAIGGHAPAAMTGPHDPWQEHRSQAPGAIAALPIISQNQLVARRNYLSTIDEHSRVKSSP